MSEETQEAKVDNPFSGGLSARTQSPGALAESDQARAVAEVQAAMVIAKRFPRNEKDAVDRILQACARPTLAESALYTYSRGGTDISGPSIRLAEAIAQNWGNIQFGIREIDQHGNESTVEAFAWDVETNVRQVKVFQVPHIRYTKKGSYGLEDPRDIYEAVANQGARRLRACVLGVIPGDVVEAAVAQCEATLKVKAEVTPERIKGLLEAFAAFGVTKEQIEARIQRRIEAMTPALLVQLGKVFNSLKDGMSSPADWFEVKPAAAEKFAEKFAPKTQSPAAPEGAKPSKGAGKETPAEPEPPPAQGPKPGACSACGHSYKEAHFSSDGEPRPCVVDGCKCLLSVEQASV